MRDAGNGRLENSHLGEHAARSIVEEFRTLPDPRTHRTRRHPLLNVIFIALAAVICGADGWEDMVLFGRTRQRWLGRYLDLSEGVPSADTFRRVFEALKADELERRLVAWVRSVYRKTRAEVIAFDGKATKSTRHPDEPDQRLHVLHVWSTAQHLLLTHKKIKGASGEVAALLEVLPTLDVRGAVLTADANGATARVTQAIRASGAHYVLQMKANRGRQYYWLVEQFAGLRYGELPAKGTCYRTEERNRGRLEVRTTWVLEPEEWPAAKNAAWKDRRTAIMVKRERTAEGKAETQYHYYITDLPPNPKALAEKIRAHWGVENGLHWVLDVTFGEDTRRVRDENAAQNLGALSRLALMLLKRAPGKYSSIAKRRKEAAWDDDFLDLVISQETQAL